jgi:serine/threonine-protein kinase
VRRAEQECDRFEAACKAGQRPRLEEHLAAVPELERPALLRELLPLEIDYRRLAGEQPSAAELLGRFPALDRAWLDSLLAGTAPTVLHRDPAGERLQPVPAADDLHALLRKRLRFISLVVLLLYVHFGVILTGLSVARNFDLFRNYWASFVPGWLAFLAAGLMVLLLWSKRPLSLARLHVLELALFGLLVAQGSWALFCDLFLYDQLWLLVSWAPTSEGIAHLQYLHSSAASLHFVLLIVAYAALIPCSWRRCTVVVGLTALSPLTISAAACVCKSADPSAFLLYYLLPMAIVLAIAVAIAAYGTHRLEALRQEAVQARKLGQYQLKQLLGSGGMGEVYLAEHVLLKQPCAVKLIRPERAGDGATLRRFEREVQATARLKHWNTVQIFDYGHAADGTFYYVMEYLPGLTLEQLVKQHGPLPAGRAVHLLRQACLALREAHALGLIHRDIKPANIMVCERGGVADVVKLLDFGLVKAVGLPRQEETLTQEGAIAGTPAYLSPEQAAGKGNLDGRSDIYSIGALAYFLLTGQPPFVRDRAIEIIVAHIHEPVPPLTELRPEIPDDLQQVVLRCLEKDPARRFADVSSLHDALAGCRCAER